MAEAFHFGSLGKILEQTYLSTRQSTFGDKMPKSRLVREQSQNGEIHLILPESKLDENWKNAEDINEAEIRRIMKKEASKPLLLLRAE
jgi:hypothetical protein